MVVIAKHETLLQMLGLATMEQVRRFTGELVKNHRGRRDIYRIVVGADAPDGPRVLYLKRNLKPYRKDGLHSLLQRGCVWSLSRQEWENSRKLESAGLRVAGLVAFGEICSPLWEKFSYILTEAATGSTTLDAFLRTCRDRALRRRVFDAVARQVRTMHEAGLASPDLFTRHVFVEPSDNPPSVCLIDMTRLDHRAALSKTHRARDLAALNATAPLRHVSRQERIRFLKVYSGGQVDRELIEKITRRVAHLLRRRKFSDFSASVER